MSFVVKNKGSQEYVVPKVENRQQATFFKFGYFDPGTIFLNSFIQEALYNIFCILICRFMQNTTTQ